MKPLVNAALLIIALLFTLQSALAFATLSVSHVDFTSNDPNVNGPAWLLNVVENGNAQYATGTFTPVRADGATSTQPLTIEITSTQNTCQYAFQNQQTPVYNVQLNPLSIWTGFTACQQTPGFVAYVKEPISLSAFCIVRTQTATVTPLATPTTIIKSDLTVTAAGQSYKATITNNGMTSAALGSQAYASWTGNLVSGSQCPNPLDSMVMGVNQGGNFRITSKSAYDQYDPNQQDLKSCISTAINNGIYYSHTQSVSCINEYNNRANNVIQKVNSGPFVNASVTPISTTSGIATLQLPQLVQFPTFTLKVKADWIGIVVLVGKPRILSASDIVFSEGDKGYSRVVIQNIGTATGSFGVSATCNAPFAFTGTTQTIKLAIGATGFVDLPITVSTSGKQVKNTCTVTAQDLNQPSNTDTKTFSATGNPIKICTPLEKRCINSKIQSCNQQGTDWTDQEVCPNGCTMSNGVPICQESAACTKDSDCNDNDPTTTDACVGVLNKHCQYTIIPIEPGFNLGKYATLIIWVIVAVLFGVLATILGKSQHWFYALHIGTAIGIIGAMLGFFALFSTLAAILLAIGFISLLAGVALAALRLAPYAITAFALGAIFIIIALLATFITLPSWLGWL